MHGGDANALEMTLEITARRHRPHLEDSGTHLAPAHAQTSAWGGGCTPTLLIDMHTPCRWKSIFVCDCTTPHFIGFLLRVMAQAHGVACNRVPLNGAQLSTTVPQCQRNREHQLLRNPLRGGLAGQSSPPLHVHNRDHVPGRLATHLPS